MATDPAHPAPVVAALATIASNQAASGPGARQQILDLLASRDKCFVFLFGSPAAGKTVVLGSLLQAMQQPESGGRLFVHGTGGGIFKAGADLWEQIGAAFARNSFPGRTPTGRTVQLHAQFRPAGGKPPLNFVFLEMAGEDLRKVQIADADSVVPFHVDMFLKTPGLKLAFILAVPWDKAAEDDELVEDFLTHLKQAAPHLGASHVVLLLTKWDSRRREQHETVDEFVRRTMPRAYNKVRGEGNVIQSFSVGDIVPFEGGDGDVIANFDHFTSQRLFARLCEAFKEPSRWSRLWK